MSSSIHEMYPWVAKPFIANAPMGGFAGPALATAVTLSGGMGFTAGMFSMERLGKDLEQVQEATESAGIYGSNNTIAVGMSLLLFAVKQEEAVAMLKKHHPAAIWLFAAKQVSDYAEWSAALRAASPESHIWIQVGSVAAAIEVTTHAKPDVLVAQGLDAGGHGFEKGASIMSLVPEITDAVRALDMDKPPLIVAAGGIADGRGVAAALALGAAGAVMGTRFLASEEIMPHIGAREAVLAARDGGQNTVRAKVFDELRGPNMWPVAYDGRSIVTASYTDHAQGLSIDENRKLHQQAVGLPDGGVGASAGQGRATVWAGTAVGLVREVKKAQDIILEVRENAVLAIKQATPGYQL